MKKKQLYSIQDWMPFEQILDDGIIRLKNNIYVKIIKITPINFSLKSDLEKQAILNSYKLFLQTCNFDIQILVQSSKIDLSRHISHLKKETKKLENQNILPIYENYINFIQKQNSQKNSSSKNFFILIKEFPENKKEKINKNIEEIILNNLKDKFFKIKECLSRCGNTVVEFSTYEQTIEIINSFYNYRRYMFQKEIDEE